MAGQRILEMSQLGNIRIFRRKIAKRDGTAGNDLQPVTRAGDVDRGLQPGWRRDPPAFNPAAGAAGMFEVYVAILGCPSPSRLASTFVTSPASHIA